MKFLLLALLIPSISFGSCNFTKEQNRSLHLAYAKGVSYDLGYTLAAITWQEAFVGKHIIRNNSKDGKYGSYGITHINLETAMHLLKTKNSWQARDTIFMNLVDRVTGDEYSLDLSIKKLQSVHNSDWLKLWTSYNGNNPEYGLKIADKVKKLQQCKLFSY